MTLFFEKELHNALFQELSMPRLYEKRISSYTDIGPFNSNRELLTTVFLQLFKTCNRVPHSLHRSASG
ncbi:conserved hypothetical protein [delta proteobacterium NaphS2]|nr:conserved hypothetical protein [delta proteobacterium NaphS2]